MISVSNDKIKLNPTELKLRLGGMPIDNLEAEIAKAEKELFKVLNCSYHYVKTNVTIFADGVDLGFGKIPSLNLKKNLENCAEAYVFGATLGFGVDRLLRTEALRSPLNHYIMDAVASTAIEALCDYAQSTLPPTMARFSCGYGDFDITNQKNILEFINGTKELGITLSESFLMTPTKSVTAIMGIKK